MLLVGSLEVPAGQGVVAMRTIPEFITLRFRNEKAWREAVIKFINAHPHAHVNSTGDFELVIPQPFEAWAKDHLENGSFEVIRENDTKAPALIEHAPSMWRDRGRGSAGEFDDPRWLEARADELEKDNERLRNQIFR